MEVLTAKRVKVTVWYPTQKKFCQLGNDIFGKIVCMYSMHACIYVCMYGMYGMVCMYAVCVC